MNSFLLKQQNNTTKARPCKQEDSKTPRTKQDINNILYVELHVEAEKEILVSYRDHLRVKFKAIDHKTEKVSDDVIVWLNETEILIQEVENLMAQAKTRYVPQNEFRKLRDKVTPHKKKYELLNPFSTLVEARTNQDINDILYVERHVEAEKEILVSYRDHVRVKFEATDHKTEEVNRMIVWLNETEILIQEVENLMSQAKTRYVPQNEFRKLRDKVTPHKKKYELLDPFSTLVEARTNQHINDILYVELHVEAEKEILVSYRDHVRVKFEAIDHKTEKVSDDVFVWLNETEILIQEVENLMAQAKTRYVPQNEFRKLRDKVTPHKKKYELLDPFSTPIPSLELFSSGNIVCFNSREKASDQLLVALKDDNCSKIGLYGRRGSGKTTLVKAMSEKVKYLKIFHEVLFVKVTQNPTIRAMQDEIADSLNLKFDKNSETGRAKIIFSTIESINHPILVVFDDVRANFDPEDVGIPCNSNRCKILLTTCYKKDCDLMYCQRDIQLGPLSTEESWTLFQKHSGIHDDEECSSFDLMNVAREVAFECEGLPRTIKNVGSSLRSKPIDEWKTTLDSLKHSMDKWQIFLSFRGEDTRNSFTGSLYQALSQGGFKIFMDEEGLQTGDQISPSLLNAIEASRLSIIVLSENYANSLWCLDELVKIMECKKSKNQIVWPIFYKVKPSDIRHLRNSYGRDMARHENNFEINSERVQKWRSALFEVSNLSGKTYTTGYEYEFIQKIVKDANQIKRSLQIQSI